MEYQNFNFNNVLFDNLSPQLTNVLKFILIQDPVKIAIGFSLGLALSKIFTEIIDDTIRPLVQIFLKLFSKTGFKYTLYGSTFDFGKILEQLLAFFIFILVLYYGFIQPVSELKKDFNIDQDTVSCPYCKTLINENAIKCPACTSELKK